MSPHSRSDSASHASMRFLFWSSSTANTSRAASAIIAKSFSAFFRSPGLSHHVQFRELSEERLLIVQTPDIKDERVVMDASNHGNGQVAKCVRDPVESCSRVPRRAWSDRQSRTGNVLCRQSAAANLTRAVDDVHKNGTFECVRDGVAKSVSGCANL